MSRKGQAIACAEMGSTIYNRPGILDGEVHRYHPMPEDEESKIIQKIVLIKENGTVFRFLFSQISPVFRKFPILEEIKERRKTQRYE